MNLSKPNARDFARARAVLASMPDYYARTVSAMHRAASAGQQKAIAAAIDADGTVALFVVMNGALVAKGV